MRIVFIGPPGSGKGTQAQRVKDYLGIIHLSTGEVLRKALRAGTELGRRSARFLEAGQLVPDDVVLGVVSERLTQPDCAAGCLFDGFPRTVPQAAAFDELLAQRGTPVDLVISLQVPEPVLRERLRARGREDDNDATIDERFRNYRLLTAPLDDYYQERGVLRPIDGQGTPDEVFAKIKKAVDAAA